MTRDNTRDDAARDSAGDNAAKDDARTNAARPRGTSEPDTSQRGRPTGEGRGRSPGGRLRGGPLRLRAARTTAACGLAAAAALTGVAAVPSAEATPAARDRARTEAAPAEARAATDRAATGRAAPAAPVNSVAGVDSRALRPFITQRPRWEACAHKELDAAGARCASIRVPLDYREPEGRTIRVTFSRIKATDTAHRIGLLMHNSGGPGGQTLDMPLMDAPAMGRKLAARYDLIGMDPRGVGRSSPLRCGTRGHWLGSAGYDEAGFRAHARFTKELVRSCQRTYGEQVPYLRHFTTRNTARDMDLLRAVLGERRTSYFGISYGTYLGAVYAKMFPQRVDRLLLDSAVDPSRWHVEGFRGMDVAAERYFDRWAAWAARRDGTYGLGGTAARVRATVEGIARQAAREPLKVGRFAADGRQVPFAVAMLTGDDRTYADMAKSVRVLHEAARGRTVEPTPELADALGPPDDDAEVQNSLQLALLCGDRAAPRDLSWYRANVERSRERAPLFGPVFNGTSPCAFWPNEPLERPVLTGNDVPGLIVQATGDPRTTYESGLGLHRAMRNSRMITLRADIHGVYGIYPNRCVYRQVNAYLSSGELPPRDTVCEKEAQRD